MLTRHLIQPALVAGKASRIRALADSTPVVVLAWCAAAGFAAIVWSFPHDGRYGLDAHAYWATGHRDSLYGLPPGAHDAYLYSPAFATLIAPLTQLPWPVFYALWIAVETVAIGWLLAPVGWRWGVPLMCLAMLEISVGNIYGLLGVAAVLGARFAGAWAFPLLTKVTPGLGPVWFAAARRWRELWASVAVTVAIAAVSIALTPRAWSDWVDYLVDQRGNSQWVFPLRLAAALAVAAYAGRRGLLWPLPLAMLLGNPVVVHAWMDLTLLAALPRLVALDRSRSGDLEDRH